MSIVFNSYSATPYKSIFPLKPISFKGQKEDDEFYMKKTIQLAESAVDNGQGPIASIIVKDGKIIGQGFNEIRKRKNPTAHAEMVAIEDACNKASSMKPLQGATIYTNCQPCPMCLGALYWSKIGRIVYANSCDDTENYGFDDKKMFADFKKPEQWREIKSVQVLREEGFNPLNKWQAESSSQAAKRLRQIQAANSNSFIPKEKNVA